MILRLNSQYQRSFSILESAHKKNRITLTTRAIIYDQGKITRGLIYLKLEPLIHTSESKYIANKENRLPFFLFNLMLLRFLSKHLVEHICCCTKRGKSLNRIPLTNEREISLYFIRPKDKNLFLIAGATPGELYYTISISQIHGQIMRFNLVVKFLYHIDLIFIFEIQPNKLILWKQVTMIVVAVKSLNQ